MARLLLIAVVLDVLVARIGVPLLDSRPIISTAALFVRSLVAALALLTSIVGIRGLLGEPRRFRAPGRWFAAWTSAAFLSVAFATVLVRPPSWLAPHVATTFVAAIAGLLAVAYQAHLHPSARTGVFCLAVSPLAYGLGATLATFATALPPAIAVLADRAHSVGQAAALVIGVPALMAIQPARVALAARGWPVAVALAGTLAIAAIVHLLPGLPSVLLGIPAPQALTGRLLAVLSLFLVLLALGAVRGISPRRRAVGRGLALLLLTGYLLDRTANLLVVHAAFVLLVRGAALGAPSVARWSEVVSALASRVGAGEPVVIDLRGEEVSRMRIESGPIDVRLARRGDDVVQVDVTAGTPPRSAPAWSATHRRASQPGGARLPEARGRIRADLPREFDRHIVVRGDGADMLDDELRRLLLALPPGALAVWPEEGARWRAFPARTPSPNRPIAMDAIDDEPGDALPDDLVGVVRAVREVARRAGVRC